MCINNYDIKSLAIETKNKRSKNSILNGIYRQTNRDLKVSENYLNDFFCKNKQKKKDKKKKILVGGVDINVLDSSVFSQYDSNK